MRGFPDNLMFTSGMQGVCLPRRTCSADCLITVHLACTSVVTEISYKAGEQLEASVEFLTQQEWEDEVQVLLADIRDPDGRETTQEVEVARSKVAAHASICRNEAHLVYCRSKLFTRLLPPRSYCT